MPNILYQMDIQTVGHRVTLFIEKFRKLIEKHESSLGRYFIFIYGSYAYRIVTKNSDLDIMLVAEFPNTDVFEEIIALLKELHFELGMPLDNEVPYEKKMVIKLSEFEKACDGEGLYKGNEVYIPKIVKTRENLSSDRLLKRFIAGMMLHPHIFIAGNNGLYNELRNRAIKNVLQAVSIYSGIGLKDCDELVRFLCTNNGNTGDSHFAFEYEEPFISYLTEIVNIHNPYQYKGRRIGDGKNLIFIMGTPRSGTTVLGDLLGTHPHITNVKEQSVFYFSHYVAQKEFKNVPSNDKARYLEKLMELSTEYVENELKESSCKFFVETTPWNLRIARTLIESYPQAVFIVNFRHYRDVILSMRRSYEDGYHWAGPTDIERAKLWAELYSNVQYLPESQTILFEYESLWQDHKGAVDMLESNLSDLEIPSGKLDMSVLGKSHATTISRPTILNMEENTIPQLEENKQNWTEEDESLVTPIVEETVKLLITRFPKLRNSFEAPVQTLSETA